MKTTTKPKLLGRKKLIKKADTVWSLYVRQNYSNAEGTVICYTCPYMAHWKRMQNGHYITRSSKYVRWDLDNMRPQCFVCNMRNQGMSHIFRENLVGEIGEKRVLELEARSKPLFRELDEWIVARITEGDAKLAELLVVE